MSRLWFLSLNDLGEEGRKLQKKREHRRSPSPVSIFGPWLFMPSLHLHPSLPTKPHPATREGSGFFVVAVGGGGTRGGQRNSSAWWWSGCLVPACCSPRLPRGAPPGLALAIMGTSSGSSLVPGSVSPTARVASGECPGPCCPGWPPPVYDGLGGVIPISQWTVVLVSTEPLFRKRLYPGQPTSILKPAMCSHWTMPL